MKNAERVASCELRQVGRVMRFIASVMTRSSAVAERPGDCCAGQF